MTFQGIKTDNWGVLMAGGDGTRLQSLTGRIEEDARPKQFCRLLGNETLLTQTRRRVEPLFSTANIITVVTRKHERYFVPELQGQPAMNVLVQPDNHGTGIAIARTVLRILLERDADAVLAFFPCDHHYQNETPFLEAVEAGIATARSHADHLVVLGAEPTHAETEYGWVEPSQLVVSAANYKGVPVVRFWEKPDSPKAQELLRQGCLWNTFVTIGRAGTFLDLLCAAAPEAILTLTAELVKGHSEDRSRATPIMDFSRDVLSRQPERLLVIKNSSAGWTDLGSPQRVFDTLARQAHTPHWLGTGVKELATH